MADIFITVSSRNRYLGTTSNFQTKVQRQRLVDGDYTIKLISASIPLSFYTVTSSNNTIIIDALPYTLSPGKYSSITLCTELSRLFVLNNPLDTSTFVVSASTGLLEIVPSANYTINSGTAQELLGISNLSDVILSTAVLYTGANIVKLNGVSAFYVRAPGLVSNSYSDFPNLPNDFMTVVDVTENHLNYEIQKYLPNQSPELPLAVKILNDIRIILTDEANNEVDLNGQHCSFTFVIRKLD
jgi:hypothetical protein